MTKSKNTREFFHIRAWKNGRFMRYLSLKSDKVLKLTMTAKEMFVCMNNTLAQHQVEKCLETYKSQGYYFDFESWQMS